MNRITLFAFTAGVLSSFIGGSLGIIYASPYTEQRTETIFVYGTLTNPVIRMYACLCKTPLTEATLEGYSKGNLTIFEAPSASVSGGLIAVSPKELARLDAYENIPDKYRRETVIVRNTPVWVYIKQ